MEVSALNRNVTAANLPLDRLAASTEVSDREKVAEVSRQFEAVLLRQIIGQAQKPLFQSSLLGKSNATTAIYQDLVTQQLADRISHGGSFGFAKALEKQLAHQSLKEIAAEKTAAVSAKQAEIRSSKDELKATPVIAPSKPHTQTAPAAHPIFRPQPGKRI